MGIRGRTGVKAGDIAKYRSSLPQADSIWNPQYDYVAYPNAGTTQLSFFTTPQGQGTTSAPGGSGSKTIQDTNLTTAGMLPLGNRFLVLGIEVEFWPGNTPGLRLAAVPTDAQFARNTDDVYTLLKSGILTFSIQNRIFVQDGPLMKFPTQTRLAGFATYNQNDSTAATIGFGQIEYAAGIGASYDIVPVYIESTQGFTVTINWPGVVALPSATDGRIGVRLNGKLVRNAQ